MIYDRNSMSTLILEIDPSLARSLEESARREHKPVAAWARERLRIATIETEAEANGYPAGWLKLLGSIDDETFVSPPRTSVKGVPPMDGD